MRLVSGDLLIEAAAQASKPLTSDEAALVRGRWLWLSEAYGVVNWSESKFTWQRSLSQTVAIDAVTGALVINNRVPADNPHPAREDDLVRFMKFERGPSIKDTWSVRERESRSVRTPGRNSSSH